MKDMFGNEIKVGQNIAKAYGSGDIGVLRVTKIVDGKIYLGKSTNALRHPERVIILGGV